MFSLTAVESNGEFTFSNDDPTPLPDAVDLPKLMYFLVSAKPRGKLWKDFFCGKESEKIQKDAFWFIYFEDIEIPNRKTRIMNDRMLLRMSRNFVVAIQKLSDQGADNQVIDQLLTWYSDSMSQTLYISFFIGFPNATQKFDDVFKHRIATKVRSWILGFPSSKQLWKYWNIEDMLGSLTSLDRYPPVVRAQIKKRLQNSIQQKKKEKALALRKRREKSSRANSRRVKSLNKAGRTNSTKSLNKAGRTNRTGSLTHRSKKYSSGPADRMPNDVDISNQSTNITPNSPKSPKSGDVMTTGKSNIQDDINSTNLDSEKNSLQSTTKNTKNTKLEKGKRIRRLIFVSNSEFIQRYLGTEDGIQTNEMNENDTTYTRVPRLYIHDLQVKLTEDLIDSNPIPNPKKNSPHEQNNKLRVIAAWRCESYQSLTEKFMKKNSKLQNEYNIQKKMHEKEISADVANSELEKIALKESRKVILRGSRRDVSAYSNFLVTRRRK